MSLNENMAAFFRAFMERNHKSLAKLQEELAISRNMVYAYSRGAGNPTFSTVEHMAKRLDVSSTAIAMGVYIPDRKELPMELLYMVRNVAELPEEQQQQFIEQFMELLTLWDKN